MDFIIDNIVNGIYKFFADLASDVASKSFALVIDTIVSASDPNKYLDVRKYLVYVQVMASSALLVKIAYEAFRRQAGIANNNNKSLSELLVRLTISGGLIFFLPWSVENIFLRINNLVIKMIESIGVEIKADKMNGILDLTVNLKALGGLMVFMGLILAISFLILGIVGGIRLVELVICILMAPISAISFVSDNEGVDIWVRETSCIVFSQAFNIFMLQFLMAVLGRVQGIMLIVISIGIIVIMVRGPQMLRTFLYRSGIGSASVGAVGSVGRAAAMKKMMSAAIPGK